jgi:hypothetical protein
MLWDCVSSIGFSFTSSAAGQQRPSRETINGVLPHIQAGGCKDCYLRRVRLLKQP